MQCAAVTQRKAFTGKIWKKVKRALHIPVSLADGCSSLVHLGRTVLAGLTPLCLWGQHFRINSAQCLRPSCIPHTALPSPEQEENRLEEQQSHPNLLQTLP